MRLKTMDEMFEEYPDELFVSMQDNSIRRRFHKGKICNKSKRLLGLNIEIKACWPWWAIVGQKKPITVY